MNSNRNTISIIDYGLGNLKSVYNAMKFLGKTPIFINKPEELLKSHSVILPGVGAFKKGMEGLGENNMDEAIINYVEAGGKLLGICLGMHLLMKESEEFSINSGLNLISGRVVSIKSFNGFDDKQYKLPHVGWNNIYIYKKDNRLLDYKDKSEVYFIHSFAVQSEETNNVLFMTEYGGAKFCSGIQYNNITAFQFHPEKSGIAGLRLLEKILNS